jgi:hypothetical protein
MFGTEENHFAPVVWHCRPTIGEPPHLVRVGCLESANTKRAATRGEIWPGLTGCDHVDSGSKVGIEAQIMHAIIFIGHVATLDPSLRCLVTCLRVWNTTRETLH